MRTWQKIGWPGLLISLTICVLLAILFLPALARARESANRASCQGNLKQWGSIFSLYTQEWKGMYPRMQGPPQWLVDGIPTAELGDNCNADDGFHLTPNPTSIFPEYANDFEVLRCPSLGHPDLKIIPPGCKYAGIPTRGDASYQYLGYAFRSNSRVQGPFIYVEVSDDEITALLHALFSSVAASRNPGWSHEIANLLQNDIELKAFHRSKSFERIYRLKLGVERYFMVTAYSGPPPTDRSWTAPVMWDQVHFGNDGIAGGLRLNHLPGGSNVLFIDGHSEFCLSIERNFPVTEVFAQSLQDSRLFP